MPAVVPQHRLLGGGREQPVPGHANTLSDTADISGEVKRRFPGVHGMCGANAAADALRYLHQHQ